MRSSHAAAVLGVLPGLHVKKQQPVSCLSPNSPVLQHQRGLLHLGRQKARVSFSLFCTEKTPQVYVYVGERSVCCCTAIDGPFASRFIFSKLGKAADSVAASAAAEDSAAGSGAALQTARANTRAAAIGAFQSLFVEHDSLYFAACGGKKEHLTQGCGVCWIGLLPFGILSAFLGDDPALVLHAQAPPVQAPAPAATAPPPATVTENENEVASFHLAGWPLGAPETFRRQLQTDRVRAIGLFHLKDEALNRSLCSKTSAARFVPLATSMPDLAVQPLHEDIVAVVWGTASFWSVLTPDSVCCLVAEFLNTQGPLDKQALLSTREEASEFLLRKALLQTVINKEKSVRELVYHPAALRAAGLSHWRDAAVETERKAALGNRRAEATLMRRVIETQENFVKSSAFRRSFSQQPFVNSDMGVLVLLFHLQPQTRSQT